MSSVINFQKWTSNMNEDKAILLAKQELKTINLKCDNCGELVSYKFIEILKKNSFFEVFFEGLPSCVNVVKDNKPFVFSIVLSNTGRLHSKKIIQTGDWECRKIEICNNLPSSLKKLTDKFGIEFVLLPSGSFDMGGVAKNNQPIHTVNINSFYMSKYTITQRQWKLVMGTEPWKGTIKPDKEKDDMPAVCISWKNVQKFIKKINELTEGHYYLPSEAEWEYACRAGSSTLFYWGDEIDNSYCWYYDNSIPNILENIIAITDRKKLDSGLRTVGAKKPNAFGLYDMLGNINEWCADWYDDNAYSKLDLYTTNKSNNPVFLEKPLYLPLISPSICKPKKVIRGGCCLSHRASFGSAYRYRREVSKKCNWLGFRIAKVY